MMPIKIQYDFAQNVLFSKATGAISLQDIMGYYSEIKQINLKSGYCVLADYTEAEIDLHYNDIATIAEKRRRSLLNPAKLKIAIIARSDVVFGMARMYQIMIDEKQFYVNVFREREEALQWLGISELN